MNYYKEKRKKYSKIFLQRATNIHNNKYDYSNVVYQTMHIKVEIICPKHGSFWQKPGQHLVGSGCRECGFEKLRNDPKRNIWLKQNSDEQKMSFGSFLERALLIHGDLYDYSRVVWNDLKNKIEIICAKHGSFWQVSRDHIYNGGCGCPDCYRYCILETAWLDYLNVPKELRQSKIIFSDDSYIIADAYNPETNTVYEFWGDYWHGNPEKYNLDDINKRTKCSFGTLHESTLDKIQKIEENNYNLIDIWEYDWLKNKN